MRRNLKEVVGKPSVRRTEITYKAGFREISWPKATLNEGLEEQLNQFVKVHTDARLIIIDTLQKVREVDGDKFSDASDYEIVTKLKTFSDEHGLCLLMVHHNKRKTIWK